MTVWGGKEGPLMMEIHIFLFSFFHPNRSDKEWQLCTTEGPTPVFKRLGGGREEPLMAEIYIFCFPIFFSNMSGISGFSREVFFTWHTCTTK